MRLAKLIGSSESDGTTWIYSLTLDLDFGAPEAPFLLKVGGAVRLSNSLCSSFFGSSTLGLTVLGGGLGISLGASGSSPSKI